MRHDIPPATPYVPHIWCTRNLVNKTLIIKILVKNFVFLVYQNYGQIFGIFSMISFSISCKFQCLISKCFCMLTELKIKQLIKYDCVKTRYYTCQNSNNTKCYTSSYYRSTVPDINRVAVSYYWHYRLSKVRSDDVIWFVLYPL